MVYEESKRLSGGLPPVVATLASGGLAGCVALGLLHPVDVVKSRIQAIAAPTAQERDPWRLGK